ncbi:MAG: lactonase family protein [bacterium]|jgi:6-phosphogluconolactonase
MHFTRALLLATLALTSAQGGSLVYFGTYTGDRSKGIYVSRFEGGKLSEPVLAAELPNTTFLALHPNRRFLYAVSERSKGTLTAFAIDHESGRLTKLGERSSHGGGPCYVSVDRTGRTVLVAHYGSGTVAAFSVRPDGSFDNAASSVAHSGSSVNPQRQEAPHAHSADVSPDNRFVIAADLGIDKVVVHRLNAAKAELSGPASFFTVKPGSGPRHLAFHPGGRFAYLINELASTITVLAWNGASATLTELQTMSTLPAGFAGESTTAEIAVHPSGRFVYGSNRGHDSIAVFAIEASNGTLTPVEHVPSGGSSPRSFAIDPSGEWLIAANRTSDNAVLFRIDRNTGRLTPAGDTVQVGSPVCVLFVPAGN